MSRSGYIWGHNKPHLRPDQQTPIVRRINSTRSDAACNPHTQVSTPQGPKPNVPKPWSYVTWLSVSTKTNVGRQNVWLKGLEAHFIRIITTWLLPMVSPSTHDSNVSISRNAAMLPYFANAVETERHAIHIYQSKPSLSYSKSFHISSHQNTVVADSSPLRECQRTVILPYVSI